MPGTIAFLLSGSGSTLANLLDHIEQGTLDATVVVVVSDREGAGGLAVAKDHGIPTRVVPRRRYDRARYSHALAEALVPFTPDLLVTGGFLTIFDVPAFLNGRALNVHPALLPAFGGKGFYGHHVHEAVLAAGCRVSGCTVHYINAQIDGGPIVAQVCVPVHPDDTPDTLGARVQEAERALYPRAIADVLAGRVRLEGGRAVFSGPAPSSA